MSINLRCDVLASERESALDRLIADKCTKGRTLSALRKFWNDGKDIHVAVMVREHAEFAEFDELVSRLVAETFEARANLIARAKREAREK